ncbi:MAG: hypothetical protein OYG32_06685 [Rhodospirillaceae bacterium]|nr:hypothetical protein [Rhodospirillaceae bacterium]
MKRNVESVKIQYENADIPPRYVDSAQGLVNKKGALQFSLYSEFIKQADEINTDAKQIQGDSPSELTINLSRADPFGLDTGQITITRRIEGNFIITAQALRSIINWLEKKHAEILIAQEQQK